MFFTAPQQLRVGNKHILGLIVAVEPFSRFMWYYHFGKVDVQPGKGKLAGGGVIRRRRNTTAQHASVAFGRAFTENWDFAKNFFEFLSDKVKRIVTDNGEEFGGKVRNSYRSLFPHAQLYYAEPKNYRFGRPKNTGSEEITIGNVRRVVRDFETAFYDGVKFFTPSKLTQILNAYNRNIQLPFRTPEVVA